MCCHSGFAHFKGSRFGPDAVLEVHVAPFCRYKRQGSDARPAKGVFRGSVETVMQMFSLETVF